MSKVILDNNTSSEHTMSTFPFISDAEPHHRTLQLSFQNLNVLHNERQILSDVNGLVSPGEVLAVMGPSGSGKTTLLDCLSGQRRFDSGGVYLNREPLSKKWRRKICYVLQEEIFFSGLTLRETVMYTALLRLPDKMSKAEKIKSVDRILEALELTFCQHTKFGDYLNRGLSGGEKKRANIACELLTNPLLMLLDEPTSGLDSHSAISLMKFLKRYAVQEQKTVVITVHQPSSQMFHMFDKLLLLYNGRTAYFGEVNNIYTYFENIGVIIKPHYNPADFVLEQLKSYPKIREKLFIAAKESHGNYLNRNCITVNTNNERNQQHHHSNNVRHNGDINGDAADVTPTANITTTITTEIVNEKSHKHDALINDIINNYYKGIHKNHNNHHINHDAMLIISDHQNPNEEASQQLWYGHDSQSNSSVTSSVCQRYESCGDNDWLDYPTSFHTQFCVLSSRNYNEAKPRMLSKLNWFQTIGLALMAGSIWFQIPRTEEFLHDLQGWMFFSQTYWMLFALFGALNSFPAEREVISKERRSGAYRLSAYYLAKMFGELPLVVTLPTVYLMISYPMLGCTSCKLFFLMLVFLLLNTIVAQSVGFFIGACCMDMNVGITLSALYTLATQLFGGYLSTRIPDGLSWIRYTSMIHYAYQNMQILEFREGPALRCGNPSSFEICKTNDTTTMFIPYQEILKAQNSTSPLWLNTLVLMMFFVVFRGLGYAVLRYVRCPKAA
ncbi:ABC transporter G family member 9 isoform X1 [Rhagoletis pomonella]|uniref:ABC transporter G family member 9 isoform X1 n=1 Tax=Rhagoletis pomonella TaxID=28610 RepID=UPI0017876E30|nr:ABC transporter G family member 9 isoform X1 [Rhagoletis pomonella]